MQFKIRQPMITIMNMLNIMCSTQLKYFNDIMFLKHLKPANERAKQ